MSQEEFAELLGVSLDTVQGWESGRRPLPATRVAALVDVRHVLMAANADADLTAALDPAMHADWLIGQTLEPSRRVHPLAEWVTTRRVHDLLVWALVGHRPGWLPPLPANGRRRGPVPDSPELGAAVQLRRQAAYLAGFDPAPDTSAWLDHLPKPKLVRGSWSLEWVAERSRAVIAAARGDPGPLRWFIDHNLADDERLESASSPGTRTTTRS